MPKVKTSKKIQEDLSEEEAIALLDKDFAYETHPIDSEQIPIWDLKKIGVLVGIGFLSFLFFFLVLFPSEDILRILLSRTGQQSGIAIDAKELKFPFFGAKRIDSLSITVPNSMDLRVETTEIQTSLLGTIFSSRVDLDAFLTNVKFKQGNLDLSWKTFQITTKLDRIEDGIQKANGEISLSHGTGKINNIPELPMIGELKSLQILRGNAIFKLKSGKIQIEKFQLDTKLLKSSIQGNIKMMEPFGYSVLDLKVCLVGTEALNNERPDLAGFLALLPQAEGGKGCFPLRGSISQPKVDLPNLGGGI